MIKHKILFVLAAIILISPGACAEEEGIENIKKLLKLPGAFSVNVVVNQIDSKRPVIVDGTTTFDITCGEGVYHEPVTLYYFFNGKVRRTVEDVKLPYRFVQTYRGINKGSYRVSFVLVDLSGAHGSETVKIKVKHKKWKKRRK